MQTGNKQIPIWDEANFKKTLSSIDFSAYQAIANYLNQEVKERKAVLRMFFFPDIGKISEKVNLPVKTTIETMMFISSFYPSVLRLEAFFQKDDENVFAKLQDEDLTILEKENIFYNPEDPNIFYTDAKRFIRHAFSIGGA